MNSETLEHTRDEMLIFCEVLRVYVDAFLKNDGDTSETSQRMCVLNHVYSVEKAIAGIVEEDLADDPEAVARERNLAHHFRIMILESAGDAAQAIINDKTLPVARVLKGTVASAALTDLKILLMEHDLAKGGNRG
jgi:hypothetical protein